MNGLRALAWCSFAFGLIGLIGMISTGSFASTQTCAQCFFGSEGLSEQQVAAVTLGDTNSGTAITIDDLMGPLQGVLPKDTLQSTAPFVDLAHERARPGYWDIGRELPYQFAQRTASFQTPPGFWSSNWMFQGSPELPPADFMPQGFLNGLYAYP